MSILSYRMQAFAILQMAFCWFSCKDKPVIYPQRKDIIETVYASGKIVSANEYQLSAQVNGAVLKKLVRDGDRVKKGQLLYIISHEAEKEKIDASLKSYAVASINLSDQSPLLNDLKLALQTAEDKYNYDSITYCRYKNLWDQHIGTKNNLDNYYTNFQVSMHQRKSAGQKYDAALNDLRVSHSNAQSQLSSARKEWKDYFIRADRDGVVYQTLKEEGEMVHGNEVVALLGENSDRVIRLYVDQQDIDRIRPGQQVLLQTDVTGSRIFEALVTCIYPVMNESDQTFRVDARFTELPRQSFIHSSVEANIIIQ